MAYTLKIWNTNCFTLNDYYGKTNFWLFKNSEGKYYKLHIENHNKSSFSKEFKIKNDNDPKFYYNIQKTYITGQFEKIINDFIKWDSVSICFIHLLLDTMK